MANAHGIDHDTTHDETITQLIEDGHYGAWHDEDGQRVFTPHMSFFDNVPPHHLASYFIEHGGDNLRLNLP